MTPASVARPPQRWQAPSEDGGRLIDPPISAAIDHCRQNHERLGGATYDVQGRSLAELRADTRRELTTAAWQYSSSYREVPEPPVGDPLIWVAGHQPQMFHPGVWFKNFVLGDWALTTDGVAINLVIDNDRLKHPTLRVPSGTFANPATDNLAYDEMSGALPFEERRVLDAETFRSFGTRVQEQMKSLLPAPVMNEYWPLVLEERRRSPLVGQCLAAARHRLEGQWGLNNYELPASQVCASQGFRWFLVHVLAQLPRFQSVYNEALFDFRRRHHLRSTSHPVPQLESQGEWLEAPFWIWEQGRPERRRLFVRSVGATIELTDRGQFTRQLPLASDGPALSVEMLQDWESTGIKIRTRALTTTLFARLFLSDLFLHGIGGGKYDELTDELIRRFFGFEPPALAVATATLRLPLERPRGSLQQLRELDRRLRESQYHPERFLDAASRTPETEAWVQSKATWIDTIPTRENAKTRCHAIRDANRALQIPLAPHREQWQSERVTLIEKARIERLLGWREYAFCLFPAAFLRDFLLEIHSAPR